MRFIERSLDLILLKAVMFLFLLLILPLTLYGEELWGNLNENYPSRHGHSMVKLSDDRVVMFGGEDENADLFNDLNIFQDNNWSLVTPENESPEARKDHDAWEYDGKMYISGGRNEADELMGDLWSYDPVVNAWTEINMPESAPGPRANHASVVSEDGTVFITGGQGSEEDPGTLPPNYELADCYTYDIAENTYEKQEDIPHEAQGHKMVKYKGAYYIIQMFAGGDKLFKFDEATLQWEEINPIGDVPDFATGSSVVKITTGMFGLAKTAETSPETIGAFRMGGVALRRTEDAYDWEISADAHFYDFETETWTRKEDMPFALTEATAYYDELHNRIKVYGGIKRDGTVNKEVLVYQLSSNSIETSSEQPDVFELSQNYPNPFNPKTTIKYSVPDRKHVHLSVFDAQGREIVNLVDEYKGPGNYQSVFDASGLTSGVYFYKLQSGSYSEVRKLLYMK